MSEYPRDRFDDVPEYTDRKGGHRAHFDPPVETRGLRWIAAAAALALAVGAFSFFILPGLLNSSGSTPAATEEATTSAPASTPSEEPAASSESAPTESTPPAEPEPAETSESPSTAAVSPSATSTQSESADPEPTQTPPLQTPSEGAQTSSVQVYNATGIGGLAGSVATELRTAGFTVSGVGDWQGFTVPQSAVYYSSGEQTAQSVGAQLGLPVVYDARMPGVVVVMASGR